MSAVGETILVALTSAAVEFLVNGNEKKVRENLLLPSLEAKILFHGQHIRGQHQGLRAMVGGERSVATLGSKKFAIQASGMGQFISDELTYSGNFLEGKFHDNTGDAKCFIGLKQRYYGCFKCGHYSGHGRLEIATGGSWRIYFVGEWHASQRWTGDQYDQDGNIVLVWCEGRASAPQRAPVTSPISPVLWPTSPTQQVAYIVASSPPKSPAEVFSTVGQSPIRSDLMPVSPESKETTASNDEEHAFRFALEEKRMEDIRNPEKDAEERRVLASQEKELKRSSAAATLSSADDSAAALQLPATSVVSTAASMVADVSVSTEIDTSAHVTQTDSDVDCLLPLSNMIVEEESSKTREVQVRLEREDALRTAEILLEDDCVELDEERCLRHAQLFSLLDLHAAAFTGDLSILQELQVEGALDLVTDINALHSFNVDEVALNTTALCIASCQGHAAAVKLFLQVPGVNANFQDESGCTAFILASRFGHTEVVQVLLADQRVNVNLCDEDGRTALICASIKGYKTVVTAILVDNRVDVNLQDESGHTALIAANLHQMGAIVKLLVADDRVDVHLSTKDGRTALAVSCDEVISVFLMSRGATL